MPSSYAHYRFGAQVLPTLPADIRRPIQRYRTLYDLGLQGPDFFFYYKLGSDTPVKKLARKYHYRSGQEVFSQICRGLRYPTEAELAYLYGLLGHYCLDSYCHPMIHEVSGESDLAHNALESEFERYLLERDGVKRPHTYDRGIHLQSSRGCARVMTRFYPEAQESQIRESLNTMRQVQRLLTIHGGAKQVLRMMGSAFPGLLMHRKADPDCAQWNEPLYRLYEQAQAQYPDCLQQLHSHMAFGEPFGVEFERIFG